MVDGRSSGVSGAGHSPTVRPDGPAVKIIGPANTVEEDGKVGHVTAIEYRTSEPVDRAALSRLMADAWPDHALMDPEVLRRHSAGWVCAYDGELLVGLRQRGLGRRDALLPARHHRRAVAPAPRHRRGAGRRPRSRCARTGGGDWLHVDYEEELGAFYEGCGFRPTPAGLIQLYDD